MPRPSSRVLTPRRFSATRATPLTWAAGAPSDCTPLIRTVRMAGVSGQLVPGVDGARLQGPGDHGPAALDGEHPVQPQPDAAPRVGLGKPRREPAECGGQLGQALAGERADRDGFQLAEAGAAICARGLPQRRPRVGQVGPRDHQHPVADAEGVDRREVLGGLGHPALVGGHHEHHRRHRAHTGQHVRDESFVPGHVDERDLIAGRQRHPREAKVDGHAAAPLRFPAVRLHPGERAHQHRLPVIHMTGGGDDVHRYSRPGSEAPSGTAARQPARPRRRAPLRRAARRRRARRRAGQAGAGRPRSCRRPRARSPRRTAAPDRRPTASDSGRDSAALGSRHTGAAAAADGGVGWHRPAVDARAGQPPGLGLGSLP